MTPSRSTRNSGAVTPHELVLDQDHVAIVQHQPIAVEPGRDDRVIFFAVVVAQDDDAKVIGGNPRLLERNELGDRVILAVAGACGERGQRRNSRRPPHRKAPDRSWALASD